MEVISDSLLLHINLLFPFLGASICFLRMQSIAGEKSKWLKFFAFSCYFSRMMWKNREAKNMMLLFPVFVVWTVISLLIISRLSPS